MTDIQKPADHDRRPDAHPRPKVAVVLVNLGTPDAPTAPAVRRYLAEFLSDPRVVEIPRVAWWPILHGIILRTRPAKSAHAYEQVWTPDGSPLAVITAQQAAALDDRLNTGSGAAGTQANGTGAAITVRHAMRYGQPAIGDVLGDLTATGHGRILMLPMYPQSCGATTASVHDAAGRWMARQRQQPTLRWMPPYYDDAVHIAALAAQLRAQLAALAFRPDVLLASFHGMPARTLDLGDPYHCQCYKTVRLLTAALGDDAPPIHLSFQSRFGRAKWLEPYTEARLSALPGEGARKIAIFAPGFAADCLETLEELAIRGRETFVAAGGTEFAYLPALNADEPGMAMIETLVRRELAGWL